MGYCTYPEAWNLTTLANKNRIYTFISKRDYTTRFENKKCSNKDCTITNNSNSAVYGSNKNCILVKNAKNERKFRLKTYQISVRMANS